MKFVAISDTHCRHRHLRLPPADAIVHAGDITYKGRESEVTDFLTWFGKLNYQYKIFIAGNHDFYFERKSPSAISKILPEGVIYLNDSGADIGGVKVWGSPVTPWFFNWAFNRQRGEGVRKHWELIPPDTGLLITHGPPFGILDTVLNQQHVGCRDLLQTVQTHQPKVHVFGHIHESSGVLQRNGTKFINASVLNEAYELVNKPIVFEL
jgi:Icc-related predicted phosphoesterase